MKITTKLITLPMMVVWIATFFVVAVNCLDDGQAKEVTQSSMSSSHSLANVWSWSSDSANNSESDVSEGRTFGRIKKIQSMLIPVAFKFGVLSTLIGVLVFLALKSVFLLKILLLINFGFLFAKFLAYKQEYKAPEIHGPPVYGGLPNYGWADQHPNSKELHVHIHNPGEKPGGWHSESHVSGPYSTHARNYVTYGEPGQDLSPAPSEKGSIHRTFKIL